MAEGEFGGFFGKGFSAMLVQIFFMTKVVHFTLIIGWPNLKLTPVGGFMGMGTKSEPCYMRGKKKSINCDLRTIWGWSLYMNAISIRCSCGHLQKER